jgi:2-dehydropantoate 2-reductase
MGDLRILVVGAGATGAAFGGRLAAAGRDVTFLVRAKRAQQLRDRGLHIHAPQGDLAVTPRLIESRSLRDAYDVVLLGLKAYALEAAIEDFAPAVGPQTMIVPMLNGLRHIDRLVERFGDQPVLGGVCIIASTLNDAGDVVQLFELQQLSYGERAGGISERVSLLDAAMQGAGFEATASAHIMQDMWDKWIFLASLGAATCLMRGNVGAIAAAGGAQVALAILDETIAIARAAGFPPSEAYLEQTRDRLTAQGSGLASSMYRDLLNGLPVEADHIIGDLIARGASLGVSAPLLQAAYVQLSIYQRGLEARS